MDRTENYSTEYHSAGYYRTLVELRLQANKLLTKLEFDKDPSTQQEFKQVLSLLAKEMGSKYQRREDVEKPELLKEKESLNMNDVPVNKCRSLLDSFRDLQEKLGITSMAKNEYELDPKGVNKKQK